MTLCALSCGSPPPLQVPCLLIWGTRDDLVKALPPIQIAERFGAREERLLVVGHTMGRNGRDGREACAQSSEELALPRRSAPPLSGYRHGRYVRYVPRRSASPLRGYRYVRYAPRRSAPPLSEHRPARLTNAAPMRAGAGLEGWWVEGAQHWITIDSVLSIARLPCKPAGDVTHPTALPRAVSASHGALRLALKPTDRPLRQMVFSAAPVVPTLRARL